VRHPGVDSAQLHLIGVSKAGIGIGIATAIFSFVGFESATAFGAEARNPLRNIPHAVMWSVVIASIFFVFALYAEILGLHGSKPSLDQLSSPLSTLAGVLGVSYLRVPITIGAICSSFSVTLACVNSGARIMLPMAAGALLPRRIDSIHSRYATPHAALAVTVIAMLLIALGMLAVKVRPIDIFNYCGVLSALSFIFVYLLIAIAATMYLRRIGELRPFDVVISLVTSVFLIGTAVTLFYPTPTPPDNVFPYLFGIYLAICYGVYLASRRVKLADAD
jgi:amino acid transporter